MPARDAKAHTLVEGLDATSGGQIAVTTPQGMRALAWHFKRSSRGGVGKATTCGGRGSSCASRRTASTSRRYPQSAIHVPLADGRVDAKGVQAAIDAMRERKDLGTDKTIHILVDDQITVQTLVDALAAVPAGEVGLGLAPSNAEANTMRGLPIALVPIPVIEGVNFGFDSVRTLIAPHMTEIRACFDAEPQPSFVDIIASADKAKHITATMKSKQAKLGKCVLALLAEPIAAQSQEFAVRFLRHPAT